VTGCTPASETQTHGFQKDGHVPGGRIIGGQFTVEKSVHLGLVAAIVRYLGAMEQKTGVNSGPLAIDRMDGRAAQTQAWSMARVSRRLARSPPVRPSR
jgi:hypothetical protein